MEIWELILRLLASCLLGGLIGLEREYRAKEAGFRTHFLVGLGSTLFMIVSQWGFSDVLGGRNISLDPARVAAQVVSGIGFIGAGTIIFQKHVVRGLTTAAGLWVTSAIGLACGSGMYWIALAATVMVLMGLEALNFITPNFSVRHLQISFTVKSQEELNEMLNFLHHQKVDLEHYKMQERQLSEGFRFGLSLDVKVARKHYDAFVSALMSQVKDVEIHRLS
ncbi:MAG: MgtC/SapB family protein [Prevotella sp.]|nr:MgtC/SapB family protein [Prevotella sp.]